ncbi:MAG: ABC transporter permease [Gammaproteobacteria bacterium]
MDHWQSLLPGIVRQIWRFKLRSCLAILCAALGVAGATTAVNFASGGREQVLGQIRRLGSNLISITAEQSRGVADRTRTGTVVTTLVPDDYAAIRRDNAGIVRSSARVSGLLRLKAGYLSRQAPVSGVEAAWFPMKVLDVATGTLFAAEDDRRSARVAVLGATVAGDLYEGESPIGERLFINRVPFEVIGVLRERGQGLDGTSEDGQVYVPLNTAMRRLLDMDHYAGISLEIDGPDRMQGVTAAITAQLRERHRMSAQRPDDFRVQSQTDLIGAQRAAADRLAFLVRWIGRSGLLVAGLGILAIAWISVRDRTREIGTRRALGATASDIFLQFAAEAGLLATVGALVGLLTGLLASRILAARTALPLVIDGSNALTALLLAIGLNLVFVSGPALRAARMDPIRALRHE